MITCFRICACSSVVLFAMAILRAGLCTASLAPSAESFGLAASPANDDVRQQGMWAQQTRYRLRRRAVRTAGEHFTTGEHLTETEQQQLSEDDDGGGGCDGYASEPLLYYPSPEQQQQQRRDEQHSEEDYLLCSIGSSDEYDSEELAYDDYKKTPFFAEYSRAQQQQQHHHHLFASLNRGTNYYPATRQQTGDYNDNNYNCNYGPHTNFNRRANVVDYSSAAISASRAVGGLARVAAAVALIVAAAAPLISALSSHWPYFVAGGICAAVSHTVAVPLDVLKTRIQCAEPGEYKGTWDALVRIWRREGGQVLFCGAGATLIGYAMQGFFKFGFFEFLKPVFSNLIVGGSVTATATATTAAAAAAAAATTAATASTPPVLGSLVAASIAAEVVGSSALTPLEAARIRMVADAEYAPGLRSGIARMISEEGAGALTRGLPAVLAKQIPYTVTKLVTFDVLVRAARGGRGGVGVGVGVTIMCALAAGVLSSLASQPGDSLLSALNNEGRRCDSDSDSDSGGDGVGARKKGEGSAREPVAFAMARIARDAGFSGLFRGTPARMMHVTSIVTVQLLIYQSIKSLVGIES